MGESGSPPFPAAQATNIPWLVASSFKPAMARLSEPFSHIHVSYGLSASLSHGEGPWWFYWVHSDVAG